MKNKRWFTIVVFFFCLFCMLAVPRTSFVVHAAEGGAPGTEQSYTCPHGGTAGGIEIGKHTCFTCGYNYGFAYEAFFYDEVLSYGFQQGIYSEGLGMQYEDDPSPDGQSKVRTYYRCKNCGKCEEHSIEVKRKYYILVDGEWVLDVTKYDGGVEEIDLSSKARGVVPIRWCDKCGPEDAGYTIANYSQWHWPNTAEITLDFTDTNGVSIADEEVQKIKKDETFSYTAPEEIEQGKSVYRLLYWTYDDAEGNEVREDGDTEVTIAEVSGDTYYIQFVYQKLPVQVEAEASAVLGEDNCSVNGTYSVQTTYGDFEKVRVGWAKRTSGGNEATITFTEVAENSDSTSGDMFLGHAVEGCTYLIAVEVTTPQGTGVYYSNEVEIPVPEVAGTITLALSEDKTSITGEVEVSVEYAEYSRIQLNWYERKAGETAGSGASTTLTAEEGNRFRDTATKANVRQGYCYRAALIVTVRGKNYTFESNEILVPEPDATAPPTPTPTNTPAPTPVPTATPKPTAAPTPIPHVCEFGDWVWDTSEHWKECECGAVDEKDKHAMTAGEPDDTYDPDIYHWKICEYDSYGKVSGRIVLDL